MDGSGVIPPTPSMAYFLQVMSSLPFWMHKWQCWNIGARQLGLLPWCWRSSPKINSLFWIASWASRCSTKISIFFVDDPRISVVEHEWWIYPVSIISDIYYIITYKRIIHYISILSIPSVDNSLLSADLTQAIENHSSTGFFFPSISMGHLYYYIIAMLPEGNIFHSTSTSPAPGWKSEAFDVLQQLYLDSGGDFVAWLWPWFIAILDGNIVGGSSHLVSRL